MAKMAKDKCTHRSTHPFDVSISTIAWLPSLCGYTPLVSLKYDVTFSQQRETKNPVSSYEGLCRMFLGTDLEVHCKQRTCLVI